MFVVFRDLFIGSIVLLWVGGAAHTAGDVGRRFLSRSARVFWPVVAMLVPVGGAGLYLLVRPARTRAERRERRYMLLYLESLVGPGDGVPEESAVEIAGDVEERARVLVPALVEISAV
jgi:membrane protein implicated in regulation of membrane protease activity